MEGGAGHSEQKVLVYTGKEERDTNDNRTKHTLFCSTDLVRACSGVSIRILTRRSRDFHPENFWPILTYTFTKDMPPAITYDPRKHVGVHAERVSHVSSTNYPGHYPNEDHSWDLERFKKVRHGPQARSVFD